MLGLFFILILLIWGGGCVRNQRTPCRLACVLMYSAKVRVTQIRRENIKANPHRHRQDRLVVSGAELSMGPFCVTRSNPTHHLTDPTQPTTGGKIWTQPDTTQYN